MNQVLRTTISMPGGFAGTPEFASPEQFAGVDVDIRSDLYSLGVMLWEMVTGHGLFRGSPAEVMYQHQHAPLPLEQLEGVPQPVAVLIEVLLEKDPEAAFSDPGRTSEGDADDNGRYRGRADNHAIRACGRCPLAIHTHSHAARHHDWAPEKISVARLPITGSDLFGREEDIAFLE